MENQVNIKRLHFWNLKNLCLRLQKVLVVFPSFIKLNTKDKIVADIP